MLILGTSLISALIILDIKPLLSLINTIKIDYRENFEAIWAKLKIYLQPFFNWRFLVSYSIPFMLVNGWAWIGVFMFPYVKNWFTITSVSWMAFLWAPFTPEKLFTIPIAIWIHTQLFKHDPKTREQLQKMYQEAKSDWQKIKERVK